MEVLTNSVDCCGCTACVSVCPRNCISLVVDGEGFEYPKINIEKCINCRLCEAVCPILQGNNYSIGQTPEMTMKEVTQAAIEREKELPDSYVGFLCDDEVRRDSTSGGIFTALARFVLQNNGWVYGVEIDDNMNIKHSGVNAEADLSKFRGSKYVQSSQCGIYSDIEMHLKADEWVLYSGTPCQVGGLKSYLRQEYRKLIAVDIFCYGVGSPKYWHKYVDHMERKFGSCIDKVKFREKTYGYNSACMAVYFKNGKSSHRGHDDDLYWTAFSQCYIFRPSCYNCNFKSIHHVSDFSIGDFWDVTALGEQYQKANGCTLLLAHSVKSKELLHQISGSIHLESIDLNKALLINGGEMPSKLISSASRPRNRDEFMRILDTLAIDDLVEKFIPLSIKQKIKCMLKPLLYRLGILHILKNVIKKKCS